MPKSADWLERWLRFPIRPESTWRGGTIVVPFELPLEPNGVTAPIAFPVWLSETPDGEYHQYQGRADADGSWTPERVSETLAAFAADPDDGGYRPGAIEVSDAELAAFLRDALAGSGTDVRLVSDLGVWEELRQAICETAESNARDPGYLQGDGVTLERVRAFAEAAKLFYRAAPWEQLTGQDLIRVERSGSSADPSTGLSAGLFTSPVWLAVTGVAEGDRGFVLFDSKREFEALLDQGMEPEKTIEDGHWFLNFGSVIDTPHEDVRLWMEHDLPLAHGGNLPVAGSLDKEGDLHRPSAERLALMEAIALALAATTEEEMDSGLWKKAVKTFDGEVELELSLPYLLNPSPPRSATSVTSERMMVAFQRWAAKQNFESMEEMDAALKERFAGRTPEELEPTATTPLERAQDLAHQALESSGRLQIKLAREALRISPDCADAYGILARRSASADRTLELYRKAVEAAERCMQALLEQEGEPLEFWVDVRTRPYMRALLGMSRALHGVGDFDAAMAGYRKVLELNPGDNQGARYNLLATLLEKERDREAMELLDRFRDDSCAYLQYAHAILVYRAEGATDHAGRVLRRAIQANRHMKRLLMEQRAEEPRVSTYARGSEEEAEIFAPDLVPIYGRTPGALAWLRAEGKDEKKGEGGGGPRAGRRRKRR